jgi:hypothetical protein
VLPSPYASSFGGFVNLPAAAWMAAGGVLASVVNSVANSVAKNRSAPAGDAALPEDMSTTSLVGGGLIAGDALAALALGVAGLVAVVG